jgi:hypothetical protein
MKKFNSALQFLSGRINLLVVEDEVSLLSMLKEAFSLPPIKVVIASSLKGARKAIQCPTVVWHCWIIDLCLGGKRNAGATFIEEQNNFPCAIVYSGLGSMESGANAIKKGAVVVIDKGADSLDRLVWEACSLMPLGVLCRGKIHKYKEKLFLLREHMLHNPVEWAGKVGVSLRHVENISITTTGISPLNALNFYYGLRYILAAEFGIERRFIAAKDIPFYWSCIEYIEKNQEFYNDTFFQRPSQKQVQLPSLHDF